MKPRLHGYAEALLEFMKIRIFNPLCPLSLMLLVLIGCSTDKNSPGLSRPEIQNEKVFGLIGVGMARRQVVKTVGYPVMEYDYMAFYGQRIPKHEPWKSDVSPYPIVIVYGKHDTVQSKTLYSETKVVREGAFPESERQFIEGSAGKWHISPDAR